VERVRVDEALVSYTLEIVRRTRESEYLSLGVSPRGALMLYRAAQAMAFLQRRSFCVPEDFKPLAVPVFAHRVVVNAAYSSTLKKSEQAEQILHEIVNSTPCQCRARAQALFPTFRIGWNWKTCGPVAHNSLCPFCDF